MDDREKRGITVTKPDLPSLEKYTKYLEKIWDTRWLTNDGEFVKLFERKLEEYLRVKNLVCVANGTLALQLALKAFQLKGEIITTSFTFSATTNVILWEGLTPVFADIDPETFNIDPNDIEKKITDRTSAILAVHVYGNPCYVEEIQKIAEEYNLKLIYDSAHAFGVEYKNLSVLNYGDISTLSFHATKVFHTIEGGAIISKNNEVFEKLKLLRNHGIKSEEKVVLPGTNAKMNEFQAVMGLCNLENVNEKIQQRKKIYERYKEKLRNIDGIKFQKLIASRYNYAYMPICFKDTITRDKVYSSLVRNGIKPRKYFYPLTANFDYFKEKNIDLVKKYNLKKSSNIANRVLCLPLYPDLKIETVDKIVNIIKKVIKCTQKFP
ncbi:MAG TPA: DegT/DnrJ/EryC1/StrS family aminotransferase [Thermoplasmata archaeon]|nr:DegT/DnrJ/EryC1/StrS family aminotransferase [Thermoplasmata archaeon]